MQIDQNFWIVFNALAQALSAFGTLAAVIVSLYLASSRFSIKVKVTANVSHLFDTNGDIIGEYVQIEAVNERPRQVQITSIGWEIGLLKKKLTQLPPAYGNFMPNSSIPSMLTEGQTFYIYIAKKDFIENAESFSKALPRIHFFKKFFAKRIQVCVTLSNGKTFKSRITPAVQGTMLDMLGLRKKPN